MHPSIQYRMITEIDQIEEVVELQIKVWGEGNVTPPAQLIATIHNGGVVIGAYEDEKLVGFCYGFPGFEHGETYLCSHMLGILDPYRDRGIGKQLKLAQRSWALAYGYQKMTWTFDPLEARNAYLNLCKLGGIVRTYIPAYYGHMGDKINKGLPADRFVLEWLLASTRVEKAVAGLPIDHERWSTYPRRLDWEMAGKYPTPCLGEAAADQNGYLVPVPRSIHEIKRDEIEVAQEWRFALREQFSQLFGVGYALVGMIKTDEPVQYYVLEKNEREALL